MDRLIVRRLAIAGNPVYACIRCGRREEGRTYRLEISLDATPDMVSEILADAIEVNQSHIPAGWVCHSRHDIRCPDCKETHYVDRHY